MKNTLSIAALIAATSVAPPMVPVRTRASQEMPNQGRADKAKKAERRRRRSARRKNRKAKP